MLPVLEPQVLFGLTNGIKGNATFISEDEILYPAGAVLIAENYNTKTQRYIKLSDKTSVNIICVNLAKNILAVGEKGEKPSISIYDLITLKKKKVLGQTIETNAKEFVSLSFSFDGKFLAAILGNPDWMMVYFNWEKGKIDSTVKANEPTNGEVTQVACNPTDNSVVVIVGPQLFRLLSASEKIWRQYGWSKTDSLCFTSVTWLSFDRVMSGTNDGRLILVDAGELRAVYRADDLMTITIKMQEEPVSTSAANLITDDTSYAALEVRELINFGRGFAFAFGSGKVHLFEKESSNKYQKRNLFFIPAPEFQEEGNEDLNLVNCLNINPSQNKLLVTAGHSQIYSVELWGPDINQESEIPFKTVGEQLHHGCITSLSMCIWKPLFMTCGLTDHTVRVWNYETHTQELIKQYPDEIYSVSIHPIGLYCVIGFVDKLRFMKLLLDDIQPVREFSIHACHECSFSTSGHLFAAVNGNVIQVYSSISFESIYNLKGHNGKVTSLMWTQRDMKIVSCGTEGAIYEWDIPTGTRIGEIITKDCKFYSVAATASGKTSYGTGSDGCITEVSESLIVDIFDIIGQQLDCIVLSNSNLMMFVGAVNGSVLSIKFPLQQPVKYKEYKMHKYPLTKMKLTFNDLNLITCSQDGNLCIWKLVSIEGKVMKIDKDFKYSPDIQINKNDLVEKLEMINDLSVRIQEMETENAFHIRQMETFHDHNVEEVHNKYRQIIEELKETNEELESDHTSEISTFNNNIAKMKTDHGLAIITIEANFNEKLIEEYQKYEALEMSTNYMCEDYERKVSELLKKREDDIKSVTEQYEVLIQEQKVQMEELNIEAVQKIKEHEVIEQQIEDDADDEIVELKSKYEKLLQEEKEINLKLRGETGVMKKKFISSQKEIEEYKHQVHTLQQEQIKFQKIIVSLERDIADLKKEITDRDNTVQNKEKQIYDLKRQYQELEKFKFVLNYKITELKDQIEPKDREIKEKKEQIQKMEVELENLQKDNTVLEHQLIDSQDKLGTINNDRIIEHKQNKTANSLLKCITLDIHNASELIQEPKKLSDTIKLLERKYCKSEEFEKSLEQDMDAQMEFVRQREYLEQTVVNVKRQVDKGLSGKEDDFYKIMKENVTLLDELSKLRKELNSAQKLSRHTESILGISSKYMSHREATECLQMAVRGSEEIRKDYVKELEDKDSIIMMLKQEVRRLVQKLSKEDQEEYKRKVNKMLTV